MSYATINDLKARIDERELISLCDKKKTGKFDTAAQAIAQEALDSGAGEIDGYARARYKLPLPVTPQIIRMNIDIAMYLLVSDQASTKEGKFEVREKAYQNAINFLKAVGRGEAAFDAVPPLDDATTNLTTVRDDRTPVFNDDVLSGY